MYFYETLLQSSVYDSHESPIITLEYLPTIVTTCILFFFIGNNK